MQPESSYHHGPWAHEGHPHPPFFLLLMVPLTMAMVVRHLGRHHWEEKRKYMEENVPPMFTRWHNLAHEAQPGSKTEPRVDPQGEQRTPEA